MASEITVAVRLRKRTGTLYVRYTKLIYFLVSSTFQFWLCDVDTIGEFCAVVTKLLSLAPLCQRHRVVRLLCANSEKRK